MDARSPTSHIFAMYEARRAEVRSAFVARLQESVRGGHFRLTSTRSLVVKVPVDHQEVGFLRDGSWQNGPRAIEDGKVTFLLSEVPPEVLETVNQKLRPCFDALLAACTEKARIGDCTYQSDVQSSFLSTSRLVFEFTHDEVRTIMARVSVEGSSSSGAGGSDEALDDVVALGVACGHTYEADVTHIAPRTSPSSCSKVALVTIIG
jgi:hypothetical protein